jgi:heme/copper-type cytochrome/quinol oxidase subunit 2
MLLLLLLLVSFLSSYITSDAAKKTIDINAHYNVSIETERMFNKNDFHNLSMIFLVLAAIIIFISIYYFFFSIDFAKNPKDALKSYEEMF